MRDRRDNVRALLSLLPFSHYHPEGGREVMDALVGMGAGAIPAYHDALSDRERPDVVRMAAAWLLGKLGGLQAQAALCSFVDDHSTDVAEAARAALDATGSCDCNAGVIDEALESLVAA